MRTFFVYTKAERSSKLWSKTKKMQRPRAGATFYFQQGAQWKDKANPVEVSNERKSPASAADFLFVQAVSKFFGRRLN